MPAHKPARHDFQHAPGTPTPIVGEFTIRFHVNGQESFACWMLNTGPTAIAITPPMLARVLRGTASQQALRGFIRELEERRKDEIEESKKE